MKKNIREISVFVDESGSFSPEASDPSSRYYILCFVAHDQSIDITPEITRLEDSLQALGLDRKHCIHAGPLIRREGEYKSMSREERRAVFQRMLAFSRKVDVSYRCFLVDKHRNTKPGAIHDTLLQDVASFLISRRREFEDYDVLKIYYDNGQSQVLTLLKESFSIYSLKTKFVSEVHPINYRLFQAADLACTLHLSEQNSTTQENYHLRNTLSLAAQNFFEKSI